MKKFSTITAALLLLGQSVSANPVVINMNQAMQPVGDLKINNQNASGYITGIDIDVNAIAVDDFNRGFKVGLSSTKHIHDTFNSTTDMSGISYTAKTDLGDLRIVAKNLDEWTFASRLVDGVVDYDVYVKTRYRHPFMNFGGVYGTMKLNGVVDNVFTVDMGDFKAKSGIMVTNTWFDKGLVQSISPMLGTWGEVSYTSGGLRVATGFYPMGLAGKMRITYPDRQDSQTGALSYASQNSASKREMQNFVRAEYAFAVGKGDISLGIYASGFDDWDKLKTYQSLTYNIIF
jgi:hypothetical protein